MHDPREPESTTKQAAWVGAAGVSGEHVIEAERAPRLHRMLTVLGPVGLALAILTSLWSSGRHVERSVNVQVETRWVAGEQLAIRTQLVGRELEPLAEDVAVELRVEAGDETIALGPLTPVDVGLVQGAFTVPTLAPGPAELVVRYVSAADGAEPFEERVPVEVLASRPANEGRQVVSEHMLQWADDSDEQPEGVRIDLRPDGRLLAGFDNRVFVRVTDPAGRPWQPKQGDAQIQVVLASGEFDGRRGDLDDPPILYDGPVDGLGLASFHGVLSSDTVRFEVRLPPEPAPAATPEPTPTPEPAPEAPPEPAAQPAPAPPAASPKLLTGPKRRLRFVSHAGTVRVLASTNFAHPGDTVTLTIDAISARRAAFVDVHGPGGAWLDTMTPPLAVPQDRDWVVPEALAANLGAGPFVQFEAYQSKLRPEDSSAIARVQIAPRDQDRAHSLAPLIERQRAQLSLPRVDKQFELGRERTYLSHVEAELGKGALDPAEVEQARSFLTGSLEAVVHGPPQALNTRAREDETLANFKRRWTVGIRWFLLGGGVLFIAVMSTLVWRNQKRIELQTTLALGLVPGAPGEASAEDLADQALAIGRARREMVARGLLTVALMAAALLLTVAMLENLVWEY